jgi:hypothetical protein
MTDAPSRSTRRQSFQRQRISIRRRDDQEAVMRKVVLSIAAAGSIFAMTAAGAAGYTLTVGADKTVKAGSNGAAHVQLQQCQDVFDVTYAQNAAGYIIGGTATDKTALGSTPPASCTGTLANASMVVNGVSGTSATYVPAVVTTGSEAFATWTFTFEPISSANHDLDTTFTLAQN